MRERHRLYVTGLVAAAAVALSAGPAAAFYWRGWPGSRVVETPTLIPVPTDNRGNPTPNPFPFPPTENTYVPPEGPPAPNSVPEPATGLAGLLGLGALAVARRVRRRRG